jgi:hypothetical protein
LKELDAVSVSDQAKLLRASVLTTKLPTKTKIMSGSFTSNSSELTGISEAPSLDDRKAVAAYIMNRINSHETSSLSKLPAADAKTHTAYLPNYMYYQFIAADKDSIIQPTSLCHGTGITGGDQYLQPDMLSMFGMFGSYLVGAGHLFQDDSESNDDRPRRSTFYMEPIHEDESVAESSATSTRLSNGDSEEDDLFVSARSLETPAAQLSIELLESIIDELKAGQMQGMPSYVISSPKDKRATLDNGDISRPSIKSDCAVMSSGGEKESLNHPSFPNMPIVNGVNLPNRSTIDELTRGQMKEIPSYTLNPTEKLTPSTKNDSLSEVKKMEHRQMGYY